jgi:hypothetical protein
LSLSSSSPENPINPWEASLAPSDLSPATSQTDHYEIRFSGNLQYTDISDYFGSALRLGCVLPLLVFSALIWAGILAIVLGMIGLILVLTLAMLAFWFLWIRYEGKNHANRLLKRRPWLIGPTHGVVDSGRITVWHNQVCIQSHISSFMVNTPRGMICFPDAENPFPWTMVPSTCFFEDQWYDLVSNLRQPNSFAALVVPPSPIDGHECVLAAGRSFALKNRTKALAWRPSSGVFLLILVFGTWVSFAMSTLVRFQNLEVLLSICALSWVVAELTRYLLARLQLFRDFSDPNRPAYRKRPIEPQTQSQWFNLEKLLFCDTHHWVLCPNQYVERVKVRSSWIEFRIGYETVLFHREGFANETAWQAACRDAHAIQELITSRVTS